MAADKIKGIEDFRKEVHNGILVKIILKTDRRFSFDLQRQEWHTLLSSESDRGSIRSGFAFYKNWFKGEQGSEETPRYHFEATMGYHDIIVRESDIDMIEKILERIEEREPQAIYDFTGKKVGRKL